jgi:hypothetical protein
MAISLARFSQAISAGRQTLEEIFTVAPQRLAPLRLRMITFENGCESAAQAIIVDFLDMTAQAREFTARCNDKARFALPSSLDFHSITRHDGIAGHRLQIAAAAPCPAF